MSRSVSSVWHPQVLAETQRHARDVAFKVYNGAKVVSLRRGLSVAGALLALPVEVRGPVLHQTAPPLEQVRTRVGSFRPVGHHVRQHRFEDFPRMVGSLSGPVPEARPESVPCYRDVV